MKTILIVLLFILSSCFNDPNKKETYEVQNSGIGYPQFIHKGCIEGKEVIYNISNNSNAFSMMFNLDFNGKPIKCKGEYNND